MKLKHKILLTLCLVLAVVIIVGAILIKKQNGSTASQPVKSIGMTQGENSTATPVAIPQISATGIASEFDAGRYFNQKYGFLIYFPSSWGDIKGEELDSPDAEKVINFNIKTADPKYQSTGTAAIVRLFVIKKANWESKKIGTKLDEDANFVFSYLTWDGPTTDHQQITDKEIVEVLKTFQLTN